jgi:membrane protease subunit HflK
MNNMQHSEQSYGKFDLGLKSFIKSLQVAFFAMVVLIVGLLVYFFAFEGFIIVNAQENVLVLRLGKLVGVLDQNWYWRFPRPINEFVKIKLNPQVFYVNFEAMPTPTRGDGPPQGQPLAPGRDNYLITGDFNIIHTSWQVTYKVVDAKKYYEKFISAVAPFVGKNAAKGENFYPGGTVVNLQNMLRNVVIKVTAGQNVDKTLYSNNVYTGEVERNFKSAVLDLDAGIVIDSVSLLSYGPPLSAKLAFDEVSSAQQQKDAEVNRALTYEVETNNNALAEATIVLAEAANYKTRIVSEIESETFYFNSILKEYNQSPETILVALYNSTLSDVLNVVKDKYIVYKGGEDSHQQVRLKINAEPKDVSKK